MKQIRYKQLEQISFADMEVFSVLPAHPIWSRAAELLDFSFADEICAPLYSTRGPKPYAPSLKLKLHIVQRYYNLSDREMEERVIGDLFIKRFLGLPVSFIGFDHSTIGLDRERMGSVLFDACHHHILAQAKQKGLWGENKEVWLVDSFHTDGHVARLSAYRLIKQAVLRVINHLKRANIMLYRQLGLELDLQVLTEKLPVNPTPEDGAALFSKLVVLAYGLLYWFEKETIRSMFWSWNNRERQLVSLERQAILFRILTENTEPGYPDDPDGTYKKRPRKERPADRLLSSFDPDARAAKKRAKTFVGDKIQVVTSATHNIVLLAEPIACNEPDGAQLQKLVNTIRERHQVKPEAVTADSAYGYGCHRQAFTADDITLAAPLKTVNSNPTGLYSNDLFVYDQEAKTVTCPAEIMTSTSVDNRKIEGKQYKFSKSTCKSCPLREQCTESASGRTVFISDYYEEFQTAKAFNETDEAMKLFMLRNKVERKNNEMKNHNGLGTARVHSREKRRSEVKIVSMVVNLKQMVKQEKPLVLGFVRKRLPSSRMPFLQVN
ncbi:transposase [Paenibacillus sp. LMG 31461]|uniref:Transposase n=1 Tax=Paenibacillus plantarum TaxID=2654975 RepID=A0ABX1X477_9BACL|nr:transposase [Paenibacillus plantarum]NOU63077.1 transposase [Paenibacillus plantarum]